MNQEITEMWADKLKVKVYERRPDIGVQAARDAGEEIKRLLVRQPFVNIIFAAAPSQNEFLFYLSQEKEVDWSRVNAFHMDEYVGLKEEATQQFSKFLKKKIFDKISFHEVYYLNGNTGDPHAECDRYASLLRQYPADIVCMGIGENTHIAFNDPHVADFNDPHMVKVVELDQVSRLQQVHDGCFAFIEDVPVSAITLTIPVLLQANAVYCMVPGDSKAQAVYHTIHSEVNESHPSTVLRKHSNATLYLDKESASKLL